MLIINMKVNSLICLLIILRVEVFPEQITPLKKKKKRKNLENSKFQDKLLHQIYQSF